MSARSRFFAVVLVVALAITVTVATTAPAAPREGAGKAALHFNPNPVGLGSQHQVKLSGFRPNAWVTVGAHYSDGVYWTSFVTDADGNFSYWSTAHEAGSIFTEAKEQTNSGALRLKATATLVVDGA